MFPKPGLEFKASLNKINDKNTKTLNETSSHYEEAIVSAVTPKSAPPKPISTKKIVHKKRSNLLKNIIDKIKSMFGIKPKKVYRNRSYNTRRKYSKNSYNKYNNKYKSFNRKKGYQGKNSNYKKPINSSQNKANNSD